MRALLFITAMLVSAAAHAQTLPKTSGDPLMEICSGFLEQNRLTVSGDAAKLCGCLVREVQAKLNRSEMEAYDAATGAAKPLPPTLQNKIAGIATQCLTEAQK